MRFECAHLRRARRVTALPLEAALTVPATTPGPAQVAEDQDGYARVLSVIAALPPAEREAAVLYYLHEQSQREVAVFLGLPVTAVNNRLRMARKRLTAGGLLPMAMDTFNQHELPDDFAERIGEIVRAQGAVIDARFAPSRRPPVLNTLAMTDARGAAIRSADVIQLLDDDLVRCLASSAAASETREPVSGARIIDTVTPVRAPIDGHAIRQLIASIRTAPASDEAVDTGIKVIDVLCPLPVSGIVALAGDMQTGKMVLVEELLRRLTGTPASLSLLVFVEAPAEVTVVQKETYRTSAAIQAIYLPVADARPEAVREMTGEIDTVVTLSRALAKERCYPAIDPLRSSSRLLTPAIVGAEQVEVAAQVRELFAQSGSSEDEAVRKRAARLRQFLTQPFFVAESFTRIAGKSVTRKDAISGCRAILDGAGADVPPDALTMIGAFSEVRMGR